MTTKHAPGPWSVGKDGFNASAVFDRKGDAVASVYGISLHTRIDQLGDIDAAGLANARLIAAAPELLESLKAMLSPRMDGPDSAQIWFAAEAVVAKAEGRT